MRLLIAATLMLVLPSAAMAICYPGCPSATTTGVPIGTTLTDFTGLMTVNTPGAVIQGYRITGEIVVQAAGVTVKNNKIIIPNGDFEGIKVLGAGDNVIVQDNEIWSANTVIGVKGILLDEGADNGTVRRNNIHNIEDGVYAEGNTITIRDNYIHDSDAPGADPHYDGIQLASGTSHIQILHNNVTVTNPAQNGALMMQNQFGVMADIHVEDNLFDGGGYTVRCDGTYGYSVSGVVVTDNEMFSRVYGFFAYDGKCTSPAAVHNANVDDAHNVFID